MTATVTTIIPTSAIEITPQTADIVQKLLRRGVDLMDILKEVGLAPAPERSTGTVPAPSQITEAERDALKKLPEVFGKVCPTNPRLLNGPEKKAVDIERGYITTIEKMVTTRKEDIRHILNNHLDRRAEEAGITGGEDLDRHGHWLIKNADPIPDTNREISRTIQHYEPTYDSVALYRAYEAGDITREQYNALTSRPEVARQIDETKAAKEIAKDPTLLGVLAQYGTRPGRKQGQVTIKQRAKG